MKHLWWLLLAGYIMNYLIVSGLPKKFYGVSNFTIFLPEKTQYILQHLNFAN